MNIQYLFHTGDIVDESDKTYQWDNADKAYKMLDDAGLPYGVLAGNHDIGHKDDDYTAYSKYFGEDRYNNNPWYGGSYKDNKGHYDLISVVGIDFVMLYMGWGIGDEEIEWMNSVIESYPERKVILNFHEYILTTGGLGEIPQRVYDEVVATNPNVCMVFSGHYHDAYTRVDAFDDNGDGIDDRNVYQILFDYQGLAEGGQGFLRLMHFSLANEEMISRTFSPSLEQYNSDDSSFELQDQEFIINFDEIGLEAVKKELKTDAFKANVYTPQTIGTIENVASGTEVSAIWENAARQGKGWYVEVTDAFGGLARSEVRHLQLDIQTTPPTEEEDDDNEDNNSQSSSTGANNHQHPQGLGTLSVAKDKATLALKEQWVQEQLTQKNQTLLISSA